MSNPFEGPGEDAVAIPVDFSNVEINTLIPEDEYPIEVVDFTQKTAKSSGNPMIKWTFQIVGGPHNGRQLFTNTVMTQRALPILARLLSALGVYDPEDPEKQSLSLVHGEIVGLRCIGVVKHREYEGEKQAELKSFKKGGHDAVPSIDDGDDIAF
jgi:hypothetical protein